MEDAGSTHIVPVAIANSYQSHTWLWTSLVMYSDKWKERKELGQGILHHSLNAAQSAISAPPTQILPVNC